MRRTIIPRRVEKKNIGIFFFELDVSTFRIILRLSLEN